MAVTILYGFDTERPYGPNGAGEDGKRQRMNNLSVVSRINELLDKSDAGRTFFILGTYLDQSVEQLGSAYLRQVFATDNPLVEIAQHTYSHPVMADIATRPDKRPITAEQLREDLKKASESIQMHLLSEVEGLRTPLGYAKGLHRHADVLDMLKSHGLKYISSSLRNKDWGINAPLIEEGKTRQPFAYENGLIEIPSHGWQDTAFTGTSRTKGTDDFPTDLEGIFEHYKDILIKAETISNESEKNIYVGLCMHPWAIAMYDPGLETIKSILDLSAQRGFRNSAYREALSEFGK